MSSEKCDFSMSDQYFFGYYLVDQGEAMLISIIVF
ncbi:hypothetical protein BD65_3234 [Yersinia ruckeri]|nr:hypothetical protein BD65_3234 [Yersinia ruckeri]